MLKQVTINFFLTREMKARLQAIAKAENEPLSTIVRRAIRFWLAHNSEAEKSSPDPKLG